LTAHALKIATTSKLRKHWESLRQSALTVSPQLEHG